MLAAGISQALLTTAAGLSVAILEKKKDPNKLVRACGQTLISMNEPFMGNICYFNAFGNSGIMFLKKQYRVVFYFLLFKLVFFAIKILP